MSTIGRNPEGEPSPASVPVVRVAANVHWTFGPRSPPLGFRPIVLLPGDSHGGRAPQRIQDKAQPAGNGLRPFQGLQRRVGSSGALPLGEPGSGCPRCCASRQGRRPFPSRRALRPTASRLAATVTITWKEYDRAKPRRGRAFAHPGAALLVAHWQRANHTPRALPGARKDSGATARIDQRFPKHPAYMILNAPTSSEIGGGAACASSSETPR